MKGEMNVFLGWVSRRKRLGASASSTPNQAAGFSTLLHPALPVMLVCPGGVDLLAQQLLISVMLAREVERRVISVHIQTAE